MNSINYDIVKYEEGGISIDVRLDKDNNTIWLTQEDIKIILQLSNSNVIYHCKNAEKNAATLEWDYKVQKEGNRTITRKIKLYSLTSLEEIYSKTKSSTGLDFIKWANELLNIGQNNQVLEYSVNKAIISKIYLIRETRVMLDFELAELYGYKTKDFNNQVKNNIEKFPERYMFQLNEKEWENILRLKFSTANSNLSKTRYMPYAFTF